MPRIRCYYEDCVFLSKGLCTVSSIELDPEDGCLTYSEDPSDLVDYDEDAFLDLDDEDLVDFEESWEDEGFEEIDFDEDDY
ncbi:MAG: hypothetical protein PVI99_05270 [Anaerolineales bacterium]|jgi:hypothetical protein